jgi:hypothetical protein
VVVDDLGRGGRGVVVVVLHGAILSPPPV